MIAGALCGLRAGRNAQIPMVFFILGGTLIGGLAGLLILLIEPKPLDEAAEGLPPHFTSRRFEEPSGVIGRFLAVAGILLCWTPFLGLILNLIGLTVNWKSDDWARSVSKIGLVVGGLVAILMVIALVFDL
jgi:hypothetical protein